MQAERESEKIFKGERNLDEMGGSMVVTIVPEAMGCYQTSQIHQEP